ncbi:hypothetical protein GCM10017044_08030 [Kordiimonas sediminis]|uniref:Cobalamin biosynthesis protein CobD n=1 Tax=Kordiimonas sediminis TaxID=1735581 RepID=A0A919AML7_9PROT|nr:hypothetical protein [Kordiimonas sediminis]GHF16151.1 hypothetical protein GCM10017044_08030 [Kordiimonas sediminis]
MSATELTVVSAFLLTLAILLDLVFGGKNLLGRVPDVSRLFAAPVHRFIPKLDRDTRSQENRFFRGFAFTALFLFLSFIAGTVINIGMAALFTSNDILVYVGVITVLALLVRQRSVWDHAREVIQSLGSLIASGKPHDADTMHTNCRLLTQTLIQTFTRTVTTGLLFILGGFALILPYLFLNEMMRFAAGGMVRPRSPFYSCAFWAHEILTLPATLMTLLVFAVALMVVPGGKPFTLFRTRLVLKNSMPSAVIPLGLYGFGRNLVFKYTDGSADTLAGNFKEIHTQWLGPKTGKARQGPRDLKSLLLVLWVSVSVYIAFIGLLVMLLVSQTQ